MSSNYNEAQLSSYVDQIFKRLGAIEAQLAVLSERAGVPYDHAASGAPQAVLDLIAAGDRMGALIKYRELTGAGLEEARSVVEAL